MRKLLLSLLALPVLFGLFLLWALSPAVSPGKFPPEGIFQGTAPEAAPAAEKGRSLKIVSYNIGYASGDKNNLPLPLTREEVEKNLKDMAEALSKLNPDLVLLQEVDFRSARTFGINQMEFLSRALGLPYGAYVVTWNKRYLPWPYWPPRAQFGRLVSGQAVLSRFPIEKQELLRFPKPASNPFWYNWFYLDRIAQKLILTRDGQPLAVFNVHLEAFDPKSRGGQAEALGLWVKEEATQEKWVGGDFNSISKLRADLTEEEKKALEDRGEALRIFMDLTGLSNAEDGNEVLTMPSWNPVKKIDHIFYDASRFRMMKMGTVPGLVASDHLPVWAEFEALK